MALGHDTKVTAWTEDLNPSGISLWKLVREDLRTHRNDPLCQGFWALVVHRVGNRAKGILGRWMRPVVRIGYLLSQRFVEWTCGISITHTTRLGRRVRIWHHSGIVLNAESIGDDVVIRQNTTMGVVRASCERRPVIEDRVEIGCGAVILGGIRVGHGSMIGANSVVIRDVPRGVVVAGVPARVISSRSGDGRETDIVTRPVA